MWFYWTQSINVFAFFVGMVASYYLYSNYIAGFFPRSYAVVWFGFTSISPLLAFICWYTKGKGKVAFILSALILAVLFNMCFLYGFGYFSAWYLLPDCYSSCVLWRCPYAGGKVETGNLPWIFDRRKVCPAKHHRRVSHICKSTRYHHKGRRLLSEVIIWQIRVQ